MDRDDPNYSKYNLVKVLSSRIKEVTADNVDTYLKEIIGEDLQDQTLPSESDLQTIDDIGQRCAYVYIYHNTTHQSYSKVDLLLSITDVFPPSSLVNYRERY